MGLNDTPSANRIHIGFFGLRNAGKSSLVNAFTNQDAAIVSDTAGTTTDPVYKSMELLPLGPVSIIDTPGIDDAGALGDKRVQKTKQVLEKTDIAILVTDASKKLCDAEYELIEMFKQRDIPYIIALNKTDLISEEIKAEKNTVVVSALEKTGIDRLKEKTAHLIKTEEKGFCIVSDIIKGGDKVVLVTPIDESAPKGRMILPQQQVMRDVLDSDALCFLTKETTYKSCLEAINGKPALVVTDSQAFAKISRETPPDIPLTSFSILMARMKGFLETAVKGVGAINNLKDGDTILISEGCTHHRQCNDIGTVKLPRLLKKYTGKDFNFEFSSGGGFPDELKKYAIIIHCGACMIPSKAVLYRMKCAQKVGIPFTNYGIALAYMNGILERCIQMFNLKPGE